MAKRAPMGAAAATEVARRIFSGSRARLAWAEEGQDVEAIIISSSAAERRWITLLFCSLESPKSDLVKKGDDVDDATTSEDKTL